MLPQRFSIHWFFVCILCFLWGRGAFWRDFFSFVFNSFFIRLRCFHVDVVVSCFGPGVIGIRACP